MRAVKAVLGLVVVLAAGMGGLYLTERLLAASGPAPAAQGAAAPLRVETVAPEIVTFADAVTAVGTARAWRAVDLASESSGRISRIAFRPGDRVVTSGDGGVFPPGLLAGQVVQGSDGRMRLRMAADYGRLEFLRVLRSHPAETVADSDAVITPGERGFIGPQMPTSPVEAAAASDPLATGTE